MTNRPIRCHNCTHHIYDNGGLEGTFGIYCSSGCLDEAEDKDNQFDDPYNDGYPADDYARYPGEDDFG